MIKHLIETIHVYEDQIGCTDDAVIHKAMQEWLELVEALSYSNTTDIKNELGDALSTILSVYTRISGDYNLQIKQTRKTYTTIDLAVEIGKRNDVIQKHRRIYSRSYTDALGLQKATEKLLSVVESCVRQKWVRFDIQELLKGNWEKFKSRLDMYKNKDISSNEDIRKHIKDIKDFPKKGIIFKDISPLLGQPKVLSSAVQKIAQNIKDCDVIVWLDARWFIFGVAVAQLLQKPFVMIRKKGKLPGCCIEDHYDLEYGSHIQTLQEWTIKKGDKVAIIDDLLATWGSIQSAIRLIQSAWGIVQWCHVLIELDSLSGKDNIQVPVHSLLHY